MRRGPVRADRAVRRRRALPLHELQEALGRRRHDERPDRHRTRSGSSRARSCSAPSSLRTARRRRSALCAARTSSAPGGRSRRPPRCGSRRSTPASTSCRRRTSSSAPSPAWETLPEDGLPRFDERPVVGCGSMARAYLVSLRADAVRRGARAPAVDRGRCEGGGDAGHRDPARARAGVTLGRRTDETAELHLPDEVEVDVVETNRGGKSTYHGPGQLVCYPILDLNRHGRDLKQVRARPRGGDHPHASAPSGWTAERIDGLTGVWS